MTNEDLSELTYKGNLITTVRRILLRKIYSNIYSFKKSYAHNIIYSTQEAWYNLLETGYGGSNQCLFTAICPR